MRALYSRKTAKTAEQRDKIVQKVSQSFQQDVHTVSAMSCKQELQMTTTLINGFVNETP